MAQLPPARLVPRDAADQRVHRRAVARDAVKRGARGLWGAIKLLVTAAVLVAVVGIALHVLQNWGEGGLSTGPSVYDDRARRIELDREQMRHFDLLLREARSRD